MVNKSPARITKFHPSPWFINPKLFAPPPRANVFLSAAINRDLRGKSRLEHDRHQARALTVGPQGDPIARSPILNKVVLGFGTEGHKIPFFHDPPHRNKWLLNICHWKRQGHLLRPRVPTNRLDQEVLMITQIPTLSRHVNRAVDVVTGSVKFPMLCLFFRLIFILFTESKSSTKSAKLLYRGIPRTTSTGHKFQTPPISTAHSSRVSASASTSRVPFPPFPLPFGQSRD